MPTYYDNDAIHSYSYKPTPDFAYRRNEQAASTLTFGVELEVDGGTNAEAAARQVVDAAEGRLYCKRDGSLTSGFEIVSHPASLAYHLYQFRWANIMRLVKQAGFRSHDTDTCGLHIHVGRDQLGDDYAARDRTAANLVLLAQALRAELTTFSRRKAANLDRWAAFPSVWTNTDGLSEGLRNRNLISRALATVEGGRYQAVNLENSATIEFRIFRGTLKRDTFAAALQLVSNLCLYAMTHAPSECVEARFVDIVNVRPWDELVAYCTSKRLITTAIVAA